MMSQSASLPGAAAAARYLGDFAALWPEKMAVIDASSGTGLTYRELDERSNRLAWYLFSAGLRPGDRIATILENHIRYIEIAWAALRSGLLLTAVNRYFTADEATYVINDSDARVLISSRGMRLLADGVSGRIPAVERKLMIDSAQPGWDSYEETVAVHPTAPLTDQWMGGAMLYSSGTTGRPKGIVRSVFGRRVTDGLEPVRSALLTTLSLAPDSVYLSIAPLYHAAALSFSTLTHFSGGTTVIMDKFDAEAALRYIERYGVTHSQWVPTMFVRLLKLPEEVRTKYKLSTHRVAVHAAAPCPVDVKRQMIEWWGPIVYEYYSGTEGNGLTIIDSQEALAKPASVGKAVVGKVHICADDGSELGLGRDGLIYFEREILPFRYHKDEAKTRAAQHPAHPTWTTLGDIGTLDEEGYLYIRDRKNFMIISGGVNIYPQAIEDALALHPKVADVAVIGVPDADLGEAVRAVVQPAPGVAPTAALSDELTAYLQGRVSRYMVPRSLVFAEELPRFPTGKLSKQLIRERFG